MLFYVLRYSRIDNGFVLSLRDTLLQIIGVFFQRKVKNWFILGCFTDVLHRTVGPTTDMMVHEEAFAQKLSVLVCQ